MSGRVPHGFWKNEQNQKSYLEWLGKKLGYKGPEDWYALTTDTIKQNHGGGILGVFGGSVLNAVKTVYPEYTWRPWLFASTPKSYWERADNRREYLEWLGRKLGYEKPEDWYRISSDDFYRNAGSGLFSKYLKGSPLLAAKELYPDFNFKPWLFTMAPNQFWAVQENRIAYLKWLGERLGYKNPQDWYALKESDIENNNGAGVFSRYYGASPLQVAREIHPDFQYRPWLFSQVPKGYWDDQKNRREYLQWFESQMGIKRAEDWYSVRQEDLKTHSGGGLVQRYQGAVYELAKEANPSFAYQRWNFHLPDGFWDDPENRKQYFSHLERSLGLSGPEDWHRLTYDNIRESGGATPLAYRWSGSPINAAKEAYPGYPFKEWMFNQVTPRYWDSAENRIRYLRTIEEELGIEGPEGWYRVRTNDITSRVGGSVLGSRYNGSPMKAAKELYPHYDFLPWRFAMAPLNTWKDLNIRKRYMAWLGDKLGFRKPEDWYGLTYELLRQNDGRTLVKEFDGSPARLVMAMFPEHHWNVESFSKTGKGQKQLLAIVKELYPQERVEWNYKHPDVRFSTGKPMELDVYLPNRKIGFEFQGEQHFKAVAIFGGEKGFEATQKRDQEKRERMKAAGIQLIEVPFGWDGTMQSLLKLIPSRPK